MLLAPSNALLAASVVLPILLVLYMLKLRRRPLRVSTIAFWLRAPEDLQANEPFQRPRPSWLLLLHLLILLSLLAALARPALRDPSPTSPLTLLIIDHSASMSAVDTGETTSRLSRAKVAAVVEAKRILAARADRRVAVVASSADAVLASPWTSSPGIASESIDRIQATDQPGTIQRALDLAKTIVSNASEESGPPQASIIIYTDGVLEVPASAFTKDEAGEIRFRSLHPIRCVLLGPPPAPSASPVTPITPVEPVTTVTTATTLSSVPPDAAAAQATNPNQPALPAALPPVPLAANRGVTLLSAQRGDTLSPASLTLFVEISSNIPRGSIAPVRDDVPISVTLNERVLARRVVTVEGDATTATTTLELTEVGRGLLTVSIDLTDALASDNAAAMVIDASIPPRLLLVQPAASTSSARVLLADVLSEVESLSFTSVTLEGYQALLDSGGLVNFDCVIFDSVTPPAFPALASLSMGCIPPFNRVALVPAENVSGEPGATTFFWQRGHQLLRHISLDSLIIDDLSHFAITPTGRPAIEEIVTNRNGPVLISFSWGVSDAGINRHVATAFDLARTNWPLQASFSVFVADVLKFLMNRSEDAAGRFSRTTQPVVVRLSPETPARAVIDLSGPTTVKIPRSVAVEATETADQLLEPVELFASSLPLTGVYSVLTDGAAATPTRWVNGIDQLIAVNLLSRSESLLIPLPLATTPNPQLAAVGAGQSQEATSVAGSTRTDVLAELWPVCIGIALALLCAEWFVYGRRKLA